jgi:hypothetical protein
MGGRPAVCRSSTTTPAPRLILVLLLAGRGGTCHGSTPLQAAWFDVAAANVTINQTCEHARYAQCVDYEAQALLYTLQGLANRRRSRLLFNLGAENVDFPDSDTTWKKYFETQRGVKFSTIEPDLCALVQHFASSGTFGGAVRYPSDGYSIFLAMTVSGLRDLLPVSNALAARYPVCLGAAVLPTVQDLGAQHFADEFAAWRWGIDTLLPNCSRTVLFNADYYNNAVISQGRAALMSVDYPIAQRAFIMNLCPLWACDGLECTPPSPRRGTPRETELYIEIVESRDDLVSVWGWSDPEHAYTNITTRAGGVVFCTFSTPNLAWWSSLGAARGTAGIKLPHHDSGQLLDNRTVYVMYETNEGDTPRILTSQFTDAWLSPNRGTVPVSWAVDPYLAELFPELWNFYASNTTANDSFVAGVDGSGYVFVRGLIESGHAPAYVRRANAMIATYKKLSRELPSSHSAVAAFLNACGTTYGEPVNGWLPDGTPILNSVCVGPPGDTSDGHYLYYYRDHLNTSDPALDLAGKIRWAVHRYATADRPFFLLAFGGLGLYGGHDDLFLFLQRVMGHLHEVPATGASGWRYRAVGAQEMARLARQAAEVLVETTGQ